MIGARHLALAASLAAAGAGWAANSAGYDWRSVVVGGGGFVDGLVFHPNGRGILYARTDMGGAYRWNPGLASWNPISDGFTNADDYGILSIAVSASDTSKVYLLTGKYTQSWASTYAKVYASTDGGRTFGAPTVLHAKSGGNQDGRGAGERLAVDPNLGSILFVAGSGWDSGDGNAAFAGRFRGTLWKSTNSGKTFDSVTTGPKGNGLFVMFDPSSGSAGAASQDVYASFDSSSSGAAGLWRSRDAGATWSLVPGQPSGKLCTFGAAAGPYLFFSFNNGLGPNGVTSGEIWRFKVSDGTWTKSLATAAGGSYGFGSVSVYGKNKGVLATGSLDKWTGGDEVWLSTDTGATWTPKLSTGTLDNSWAPWSAQRSPHWLASVQMNPFDSTEVLFGTGYGVFRTTNFFAAAPKWAFADSNLEETVAMQLVAPVAGAPLVSAMGDQGGFRHAQLDKAPSSYHLPDVGTTLAIDVAWNKPSLFVKAHNSKSTNGGMTYGSISLDSAKTWTGFAAQPSGIQVPSDANGWKGGGGTKSIAVSADGASIVWSPIGASGAYVSKDSGKTWKMVTGTGLTKTSAMTAYPAADRVDPSLMYLADPQGGKFYYSVDGGSSFAAGSGSLDAMGDYDAYQCTVNPVPGNRGDVWITWGHQWSSPRGLYHSVDGGKTFDNLRAFSDAWLVGFGMPASGMTYPAIYVYGKRSGTTGVYRSTDSASTWTRIDDATHLYGGFHSLVGDPNVFGRIFIGTEGRGIVWAQPAGASSVGERPSTVSGSLRRIGTSLLGNGSQPIRLMDLRGNVVRSSIGGSLELSRLPRGFYVARQGTAALAVEVLR